MTDRLHGAAAARVFACFAAAYFLSYALRAINAVIAPHLVAEFGLDSAQLGALTSAYLIAFAGMQLPLGWCLDRFGPRRTEAALLLVAAAGCALFAAAGSVGALWAGRALIGAGVSACLMGAFKGFRFWFAPQRQGQLGVWMLVVGTAGALATTVPVQAAVPLLGWRGVFWLLAVVLAASAAALILGVPRRDRDTAAPAAAAMQRRGGYRALLGDPFFWRMALIGVFYQGGFIALQTLWAGPWFTEVLGATPRQASYWLLAFNGALLASYLVLGWLAPRLQRRGWLPPALATVSNAAGLAVLGAIVLAGARGSAWWWGGVAAATTVNMLLQTHVHMSYPLAIAGRVSTAFNFLLFGGAFGLQWSVGVLIDAFQAAGQPRPVAFQQAFAAVWALQAAALAGFVLLRARSRPAAALAGPASG